MNYITKETTVNLFGKPKRFVEVIASQPIVAEMFFKRMKDYTIDADTLRLICWMFPESTDEVVDRILVENLNRINSRNHNRAESLESGRRYMTAMSGSRIAYCEQNNDRVVVRKVQRISRPIDRLHKLFEL